MQAQVVNALSLAAAPTFAAMALVSSVNGSPMETLCTSGSGAPLLTGMATMYLLMSAFHLTPWLKLVQRRDR
jgi:hypothetical protein